MQDSSKILLTDVFLLFYIYVREMCFNWLDYTIEKRLHVWPLNSRALCASYVQSTLIFPCINYSFVNNSDSRQNFRYYFVLKQESHKRTDEIENK